MTHILRLRSRRRLSPAWPQESVALSSSPPHWAGTCLKTCPSQTVPGPAHTPRTHPCLPQYAGFLKGTHTDPSRGQSAHQPGGPLESSIPFTCPKNPASQNVHPNLSNFPETQERFLGGGLRQQGLSASGTEPFSGHSFHLSISNVTGIVLSALQIQPYLFLTTITIEVSNGNTPFYNCQSEAQ